MVVSATNLNLSVICRSKNQLWFGFDYWISSQWELWIGSWRTPCRQSRAGGWWCFKCLVGGGEEEEEEEGKVLVLVVKHYTVRAGCSITVQWCYDVSWRVPMVAVGFSLSKK